MSQDIIITLPYKEIFGAVASVMGIVGTVVYIRSILAGKTKPHLYTWIVFSILTSIAFFAQLSDNAGPGAWVMGVTAISCIATAILSIKFGEKSRTKSDKIALVASLSAILPWLFTNDALLSVIMISAIDAVAMFPTLRKSWHKPYEENLPTYVIANIKSILSLIALTNFTLITSLYLISIMVVNTALISVCLHRRKTLVP